MKQANKQRSGTVAAAASGRSDEALSRADWIEAAVDLLAARGLAAVKITRLADDLGVTRGSFYWHFKDREDLLSAIVKLWEQRNTKALLDAIAESHDLVSGIMAIFECWLTAEPFAPRLDAAMRDWGHQSPKVRRAVKRADSKRLDAIAEVFRRAGFASQEADIRARVIYYTQVGYYALEEDESIVKRNTRLAAYYKVYTGQDLDDGTVAAFLKRVQRRRTAKAGETAKGERHNAK
jgi:AcrR family transcriptional regulator